MEKAILDSSFILTCARQKVDFSEELYLRGIHIIIPQQVLNEIETIAEKGKGKEKATAQLAVNMLKKSGFKKINLEGKNVDNSIIKFSNDNQNIIVATLDREIKKKTKNRKLVIKNKKKLEVI